MSIRLTPTLLEASLECTLSQGPCKDTDWYINGDGDEALNVYLYITYDVQLVECYMDENAGGSLSLEDNSVFFDNDMTKISVSYTA